MGRADLAIVIHRGCIACNREQTKMLIKTKDEQAFCDITALWVFFDWYIRLQLHRAVFFSSYNNHGKFLPRSISGFDFDKT